MGMANSPIKLTLNFLSKKWMFDILDELLFEELRFSELEKRIPEMSGKVLSERLKELFDYSLINKVISNLSPLEFKYKITDHGSKIRKLFYELALFGSKIFREEVYPDNYPGYEDVKMYFKNKYK